VGSESAATDSLFSCGPESKFLWCSETDFQVFTPGRLFSLGFLTFFFFSSRLALASFLWTPSWKVAILEAKSTCSYSKAIDIQKNLRRRYQEHTRSGAQEEPLISRFSTSPPASSLLLLSAACLPNRLSSFIKINPFNGPNTDLSENVEGYLDDVETAAFSRDFSVTPVISEATDPFKIRLFRQNLERNGDAWHWWYYVLPEANKTDCGKIMMEFKDRYRVKATQASSLFSVQNEMLSLLQRETEHICDYVDWVEKLSRKIARKMDSLFAIAFVKGIRDQERT